MEKNNLGELPKGFDWRIYLIMNIDLIQAGITSEEQATQHYLIHGMSECRIYYSKNQIDHFVYCGQKCGSQTLRTTLTRNNIKSINLHNNTEFIFSNPGYDSIFNLIDDNSNQNDVIYVIDSYRNPIERKLSAFFYNLEEDKYDLSIDELTNEFNDVFIKNTFNIIVNFEPGNKEHLLYLIKKISEQNIIYEEHDTYVHANLITSDNLNIFCKILDENKQQLGIRYYNKKYLNDNYNLQSCDELFRYYNIGEAFVDFDFEKKYGMHKHNNIVFLKIRFCDIDNWDKILSTVFGKDIKMFPQNLSESKVYYDLYKKFKDMYRIPREFIKELLKDKHFNTYNTTEEKRKYINYWMDRSC